MHTHCAHSQCQSDDTPSRGKVRKPAMGLCFWRHGALVRPYASAGAALGRGIGGGSEVGLRACTACWRGQPGPAVGTGRTASNGAADGGELPTPASPAENRRPQPPAKGRVAGLALQAQQVPASWGGRCGKPEAAHGGQDSPSSSGNEATHTYTQTNTRNKMDDLNLNMSTMTLQ